MSESVYSERKYLLNECPKGLGEYYRSISQNYLKINSNFTISLRGQQYLKNGDPLPGHGYYRLLVREVIKNGSCQEHVMGLSEEVWSNLWDLQEKNNIRITWKSYTFPGSTDKVQWEIHEFDEIFLWVASIKCITKESLKLAMPSEISKVTEREISDLHIYKYITLTSQ